MIYLIACISKNGVIGNNNELIFRLNVDMKIFTKVTNGNTVIMGRKTWESIPLKNRPLKNRKNIVLSRDKNYVAPGATVMTFEDLRIENMKNSYEEFFVIGGAEIYSKFIDKAKVVFITEVDKIVEGDAYFPVEGLKDFDCMSMRYRDRTEKDEEVLCSYKLYRRRD